MNPRLLLCVATALSLCFAAFPDVARADDPRAFVDDTSTPLTAPGTLYIIRETPDPDTGLLSLRVRYVSSGSAPHTLSALIVLRGGAVFKHADLSTSQLQRSDTRHLAWADPSATRGVEDDQDDVRVASGAHHAALRLETRPGDPVDEIRLLIDPLANPASITAQLTLITPSTGAHEDAWPAGDDVERIVIGSPDPLEPDSGERLGAHSASIRLTREAIDVAESLLSPDPLALGSTARFRFTVRGCDDLERCTLPLEHIAAMPQPFVGPQGETIDLDTFQIELPEQLGPEESATATLSVVTPADITPGHYLGSVIVFEDNDGDGRLGPYEVFDELFLQLDLIPVDPSDPGVVIGDPGVGGGPSGPGSSSNTRYLRGGEQPMGCSTSPASPSGSSVPAVLLMLLALVATRRSRFAAVLLTVGTVTLSGAVGAQELDVDRLTGIGIGAERQLSTDFGFVLDHGDFALRVGSMYSHHPLTYFDEEGLVGLVIEHRVEHELSASFGLFDRIQVDVLLPWISHQAGPGLDSGTALPTSALGDPRLGVRASLLPSDWESMRAVAVANVIMPFGDGAALSGATATRFELGVLLAVALGDDVELGLNLGTRLGAGGAKVENLELDHELRYALAFSWEVVEALTWTVELPGSTPLTRPFTDIPHTPLEVLTGFAWTTPVDVEIVAGVGTSVVPGYGVPSWRALLNVAYRPSRREPQLTATPEPVAVEEDEAPSDLDGDGVVDGDDACPELSEDFDGFEDADGCPDNDNDGDGILDRFDGAPMLAEDVDGWQDEDGIPEPDNDFDSRPDALDACPLRAEDFDGFADEDGCPDDDNDEDGVHDHNDLCLLEPGRARFQGCPKGAQP